MYDEVNSESIGMSTGISDRLGHRMFEGDVVALNLFGSNLFAKGTVLFGIYGGTHIGFYIDWMEPNKFWRNDILFWKNYIEIIGNIYENPELLTP